MNWKKLPPTWWIGRNYHQHDRRPGYRWWTNYPGTHGPNETNRGKHSKERQQEALQRQRENEKTPSVRQTTSPNEYRLETQTNTDGVSHQNWSTTKSSHATEKYCSCDNILGEPEEGVVVNSTIHYDLQQLTVQSQSAWNFIWWAILQTHLSSGIGPHIPIKAMTTNHKTG